MAQTGLVLDEVFQKHDSGPGHPERADRLRAITNGLTEAGLKGWRWRVRPNVDGVWGEWSEERSFSFSLP